MTQQPPPLPDPDLAIDDSRVTVAPKRSNTAKVLLIVGACCFGGFILLGLLLAILIPTIFGALEQAKSASCMSNLKQIGIACSAYAAGHRQNWPTGFAPESTAWNDVGNTRFPNDKSDRGAAEPVNSNTAGLWLLAKSGLCQNTAVFICPSTDHQQDVSIADVTSSPVRDFPGEANVSYSYQNTFQGASNNATGTKYILTSAASPSMAVAADANPQRRDFWSGAPGSKVTQGPTDKKLAAKPNFEVPGWGPIDGAWDLNSPNHGFRGQNVLYLDGHVEWQNNPFAGAKYDNIWTAQVGNLAGDPPNATKPSAAPDPNNVKTLQAYTNTQSYDGKSALVGGVRTDSFLVP